MSLAVARTAGAEARLVGTARWPLRGHRHSRSGHSGEGSRGWCDRPESAADAVADGAMAKGLVTDAVVVSAVGATSRRSVVEAVALRGLGEPSRDSCKAVAVSATCQAGGDLEDVGRHG